MGKDKDRNDRTGKLALLVTSVKQVDSKFVISGITKDGRAVVNCNKRFMPGEFIEADGELHETENIKEMSAERVVLSDERKVKREIGKYIDSNVKVLSSKPYIADAVMKRLSRRLDEAARKILKAIFMHRPIIIRHHNDTDGVCSGLALYIAIGRAKNVKVIINKYPAYRMVEAQQDIDLLRSLDAEYLPPLLVIMDFGSSIDSFDTYDYVRKSGFEIVVVDHHPPSPGLEKHVDLVVSAHLVGGGSAYVAGLLSTEISQRIAKVHIHGIPYIAMVGDRSALRFERKEVYLRNAIALDYLVSVKEPTMDEIARNFFDKEAMETNYMLAMERINTVKRSLFAKVRRKTFGNTTVFTVNTDKEFEQGHFPSRGTMANLVSDEFALNMETPAITIGHGTRNINMRFNSPALAAGWNGAHIVERIRKELPNALESGGGHPGAVSMRIYKGFAKIVLDHLLKCIEEEAKKKK